MVCLIDEIEYQDGGGTQLVLCAELFNRDEDAYVQRLIARSESSSSDRHHNPASLTLATTHRASSGLQSASKTTAIAAVPGRSSLLLVLPSYTTTSITAR